MCAPIDPAALGTLPDERLQALSAALLREYAARAEARDVPLPVLPRESSVTATEAMLFVSAILKAVNIQVFELGMWQSWSGR
ncbi:hypothetical protein [Pseudorhodoplanes sp.]|uniref:hypothetical protein n=1 Tax=Pseudorhodoplanes sp. TaxID=1934341 RepID=UPI00391A35F8